MKISKTNYFKAIQKIRFENLPLALKQAHTVIMTKTDNGDDWSLYNKDPELKKMIDLVFTKVEELIKSIRTYMTPKDAAMMLLRKSVVDGWEAEQIHDIELSEENSEYAAHVDGENVIVTMIYGSRIRESFSIDQLVDDILNNYLSEDTRKRLAKKRNTYQHKQPEFKILKALTHWGHNTVTKEMIKQLLGEIKEFRREGKLKSDSPVGKEIKVMEKKLNGILQTMGGTIQIQYTKETTRMLHAALKKVTDPVKGKKDKGESLSGVAEPVSEKPTTATEIIPSETFVKQQFTTIGLTGKWKALIGDPCPGFKAAVSGLPKMGKSYLCVEFADYMASNHGPVLYISKEEFGSPTLQLKLREKNVSNPNLDLSGSIPSDLAKYNTIFLDSVTSLKLSADDLKKIEERNPGKNFVYVFQVTKNGKARGTNEFMHNVDIIITLPEKGKAVQNGRYNQGGELEIFPKEAKPKPEASDLAVGSLAGIRRRTKHYKDEGSAFIYVVDLDERGSFRAHVEDSNGSSVFEVADGNELEEGESSVFEDGFMKHSKDVRGLERHLKDLQVIGSEDWLTTDSELQGKPDSTVGNNKNEIVIDAEIFVPFDIVSMALSLEEDDDEQIERFAEEQPEKLNQLIKDICEDELTGSNIQVEAVKQISVKANMDGAFFYRVTLKGSESNLREKAGESEIFRYDWSKNEKKFNNNYLKRLKGEK